MEKLPIARDRPALGYVFGAAACGLGMLARVAADSALVGGYPFVTFLPAVVLTAFLFGLRPGLFAAALSWLLAHYFFIPPVHSFAITRVVLIAFLFYAVVVAINLLIISTMQRANRALREAREKSTQQTVMRELMFSELQHRISNKLQIIASLLTLQRRQIVDPDAQKALEEAALRVGMIGRISRALHDPDRGGLGVRAFLEQVGRDIIEAAGAPNVRLAVESDPDIEFAPDSGVPIALVIAETISNALEHGFQSRGEGSIAITVRRDAGDQLLITVADDGCGVAPGFDPAESRSLGLRIATTLARQLGGSYALKPGTVGAVAELRVKP